MTEHTDAPTHRPRRRPLLAAGLLTLALAGVGACQPAPGGPGDPTTEPTTDASTTPEPEPTDPDPTEPAGELPDVSDAVIPACGETFALPERTSELVVDSGPSEALPAHGGGWATTVTSTAEDPVQGFVAMQQVVVVDGDGRVVVAPDPEDPVFMGAEGPFWMGVAPGETLTTVVQMDVACETGDWLPAGDYEVFATITFVAGSGEMEQAQGGPWPLTVGEGDAGALPASPPDGAVPVDLACGASWAPPQPGTGYGLQPWDGLGGEHEAGAVLEGDVGVDLTAPMHGLLFPLVVVLRDGEVVNHQMGGDTATTVSATAGTHAVLDVAADLLDCGTPAGDPAPLPPGSYQAVLLLATMLDGEPHAVAVTEPVDLELT